jgi:hypothetical protein
MATSAPSYGARPALTAQGRVRRVRFGSEWGADLEDNRLSSLCRPTGTHAPSSTNSQRPSMIMRSGLTDTEEVTGSNPAARADGKVMPPVLGAAGLAQRVRGVHREVHPVGRTSRSELHYCPSPGFASGSEQAPVPEASPTSPAIRSSSRASEKTPCPSPRRPW